MKRFLSFLLVVVLLFSLAVPAFADVPIVGAETVSPATAFGSETVEPVIGAPAVDAVEVPASAELALSAPAMGEPFAVADNSALPSAILSNIPPNTPVNYTLDGVKHSFSYLFTPPLPPQGYLVEWYLDGSRVYDGSFGYSCGNRGLNFDFFVNLRKTNGFFIPSFGYSHTHDDGTFCNRLDIYNTENFSNIKIPLNAVIDGVENPNPDLGDDKTNGFEGEYGARILLPRNDFKQSKLNTIATKIYYKIPYNGVITDVKIAVSGYVGDRQDVTYHKVQELSGKTVLEGYLDVAGAVSWNKITSIAFTITDYNGKSYTCSVDVTCYDDFIDDDNDGLDDRTNQDEWTGSPDLNKPLYPDNSPPEGANVIEWVKWFFNSIGEFFATLKSGFDSVIGYGADFSKFLSSAFSYLPSEISVIIGLGFAALVFLRIFGR